MLSSVMRQQGHISNVLRVIIHMRVVRDVLSELLVWREECYSVSRNVLLEQMTVCLEWSTGTTKLMSAPSLLQEFLVSVHLC